LEAKEIIRNLDNLSEEETTRLIFGGHFDDVDFYSVRKISQYQKTALFIRKAKRVHGEKYDYSDTQYVGVKKKVTIVCPTHGKFEQKASDHLRGSGCKKCNKYNSYNKKDFVESAKNIHGDKYYYSKVKYGKYNFPVTIICPIHGEFEQKPKNHLNGHGCPYCGGSLKLNLEGLIKRSKSVHGNKYDYSKVEYSNVANKVTIICPIHGEFKQKPNDHLRGCGCKKCGIDRIKKINSYTTEKFVNIAKNVHGKRYDYSKVDYKNKYTKVTIICPIHGKFLQTPDNHIHNKAGCPMCKSSRGGKRHSQIFGRKWDII